MNTPRGGWATRTDRGEPYLLEQQAGHLLRRAHQRHTAIFQEIQGDSQLTPLQFAALVKLRDIPIDAREFGEWGMAYDDPFQPSSALKDKVAALLDRAGPSTRAHFIGSAEMHRG